MRYKNLTDFLVHPPKTVTGILPNFTWRINTPRKELFITFDDGPVPGLTPKVLNILDIFDAEATFFCVGENVKKYPEIYTEILRRGHNTGNHTYNHLNGFKTETQEYIKNTIKGSQLINSKLFRPPYGKIKRSQITYLKHQYDLILWDVLTLDYSQSISPKECYNNVQRFAKPGSVIVFHDNYKAEKNMLYALTKTLIDYTEKGYRFKKITPKILHNIKHHRVAV